MSTPQVNKDIYNEVILEQVEESESKFESFSLSSSDDGLRDFSDDSSSSSHSLTDSIDSNGNKKSKSGSSNGLNATNAIGKNVKKIL